MQDRYTYTQENCFQKPAMRRALGELTNSPTPRRALGELTNSPTPRRALGELTNSPRLLEQHSPRFLSPNHATPTKDQIGVISKKSPAITPTHNLKLLTELAAKVAGGNSSSARQTLQFEDIDTSRYNTEPVCLGSSTSSLASPHKDHSYPNKKLLNAKYEPKDEVCENYVKLEPTVTAEEARIETGLQPLHGGRDAASKKASVVKLDPSEMPAPMPRLPASEAALFVPPVERGNRKDKSLGLLAERMLQNYPYAMSHGDSAEVQLDDTAKLLHTERRRVYDIVNVFEAVQMMSRVCKNVYRWHGRTYLVQSLAWMRQLGIRLGMQEHYRQAREQEVHDIENLSPLTSPRLAASPASAMSPMMSPYGSPGMSPYGSPNDPSGTSMGINTQKFLMLFLVMPGPRKLTLEFAAKVIHGPNPNEKAKVTRVRRLYDIANILQALGLIRKIQIADGKTKKPAFEYIGPNVEHMELSEEEKKRMPSARQKNSLLAVGKNLAQLPDRDESDGAAAGRHSQQLPRGIVYQPPPSTSSATYHYHHPSTSAATTAPVGMTISASSFSAFSPVVASSSATADTNNPAKRGRSLSGDRMLAGMMMPDKLVRTHSEPRGSHSSLHGAGSSGSLLELGAVCQLEREKMGETGDTGGNSSGAAENDENNQSINMKPPTPECPNIKRAHLEAKMMARGTVTTIRRPVARRACAGRGRGRPCKVHNKMPRDDVSVSSSSSDDDDESYTPKSTRGRRSDRQRGRGRGRISFRAGRRRIRI